MAQSVCLKDDLTARGEITHPLRTWPRKHYTHTLRDTPV
jgi:hypothetical protein